MKVPITEETTVQIVHTLFAKLATIRRLNPDDLLVPEQKTTYEKTLEQTYDALVFLEKAIDHLATELEYQQARIEQAPSDVQGQVEHGVGFSRRNYMVPIPEAASFDGSCALCVVPESAPSGGHGNDLIAHQKCNKRRSFCLEVGTLSGF